MRDARVRSSIPGRMALLVVTVAALSALSNSSLAGEHAADPLDSPIENTVE